MKKEFTIWEYACFCLALITLLFVMALISADQLRMRDGLKIVYFSTLPLMIVRSLRAKGKYLIYLLLYLSLLIFIFK